VGARTGGSEREWQGEAELGGPAPAEPPGDRRSTVIAKVTKGADFGGVLRYLYGAGRAEEHHDPHRVAGNVFGDDPAALAAEFALYTGTPAGADRPVWHASLRLAPQDRALSDDEWDRGVAVFLDRMGFLDPARPGRDTPYVAVRHAEDHVHVVAGTVRFDGTRANTYLDYSRSHAAARAVETELGLVNAAERVGRGGPLSAVSIGERSSAARRGIDPERAVLRAQVAAARDAAAGRGRGAFEAELAGRGVSWRANVAGTGRMNGYSFTQPGWTDKTGVAVWLPASKVDRTLRWAELAAVLGDPARTAAAERGAGRGGPVAPAGLTAGSGLPVPAGTGSRADELRALWAAQAAGHRRDRGHDHGAEHGR